MADPILTDHFRVQAVFQHDSGMAEDRFINSWAFRSDDVLEDITIVGATVGRVLDAFYLDPDPSARTVWSLMAGVIASLEYRVYDLGQPPPREPFIQPSKTLPTRPGGSNLPFEVAACLSLRTEGRGPRDRGRLYIGPLNDNARGVESGRVTVSSALRETLINRAANVLNTTENVTWVLVSQADVAAKPVTGGYVDDAFDTVRKRGTQAANRSPFGSYLAPT